MFAGGLAMTYLNLADIQGFILRGYNMNMVRHFVLKINNADKAKHFVGSLVNGEDESLQVTTALDWGDNRPPYCLNIGFTFAGLKALKLPEYSLASFTESKAFADGAVNRAALIGDTGESAPENWKGKLGTSEVHVLLSLYTTDGDDVLETKTKTLETLFQDKAVTELGRYDGKELSPSKHVHFGFRDGISQPWIEGAPPLKHTDLQSEKNKVPAGAFLLGYESQWKDFCYPVPQPPILGVNGSFVAFRILKQDVAAFKTYLKENAPKVGMSEDQLAAKMCGRWYNGTPVTLSAEKQLENTSEDQLNSFDYSKDLKGYGCPLGAHIRRTNPRSDTIAGNTVEPGSGSSKRRIIRRGMPYGPDYRDDPDDKAERGLLGLFICVSLEDQFEFLMSQWVNEGGFNNGLPTRTKDPLIGSNTPDESKFIIPVEGEGKPRIIRGFSRFVTTRGAAYCFLPSITALKYIAKLESV
jgi:Dyp-type peroxidase family